MKPKLTTQLLAFLIVPATLAAGVFLAWHHPLSPTLAVAACILAFALCISIPHAWLVLLPALLPIVDLAPWSGWLSFEEFDILALGAAAGAWLRHSLPTGIRFRSPTSATLLGLTALYLVLLAVAFVRGLYDAGGGGEFGWFQGYDGPMNSLRLGKSFILAALFAPLLGNAMSRQNPRGIAFLAWGMAIGLAMASLAALWERVAFPGLLNFSADYRTTALFWEMHVGGAALDGFLALTLPFAVLLLLRAHGLAQLLPAAAILALGAYASLTTFSRGVYLAALVSMIVMAALWLVQMPTRPMPAAGNRRSLVVQGILGLGSGLMILGLTYLVFRHGGYRSLAAILGCLVVWMLATTLSRQASSKTWGMAIAGSIFLIAGTLASGWLLAKGAYLAYASTWLMAVLAILASHYTAHRTGTAAAIAAVLALPVAAAQVAAHWGGSPALADAAVPLLLIVGIGIWNLRADQLVWPTELRKQGAVLAGIGTLAAVTVIFGGGAYMGNRFSTSERDFSGRLQHWQAGLELLRSSDDWLLGKGLGRFPPTFFFGAPGNEYPGSYRLAHENENSFLSLSGPRYQIGYGEVLRISQRIRLGPPGRYRVTLDGRPLAKGRIWASICTKHLLYPESCTWKDFQFAKADADWKSQTLELDGSKLLGGPWYAPRLAVFSIALETMGGRLDVDNLSVTDPLGREVLANGRFSNDMARWFFTSDHHHMPWHMKNMYLHVLFEQGVLGLAAFALLILTALKRSILGRKAHHPLAPAIVAGIVGFLVVGLFDSLLDVPRVAFLFFLLLMIGIQGRRRAEQSMPADSYFPMPNP